jgi:hypothetical protein
MIKTVALRLRFLRIEGLILKSIFSKKWRTAYFCCRAPAAQHGLY